MYGQLNVLIVDPDLERRMRLKHAGTEIYDFGKISQCGGLRDAAAKISEDERVDLVFLSQEFDTSDLAAFIREAKSSSRASSAAFILVAKAAKQAAVHAASGLGADADGFLYEPYSVNALKAMIAIAEKVKLERDGAKKKAALGLLIRSVLDAIDEVAYNDACGRPSLLQRSRLKAAVSNLQGMQADCDDIYFSALFDVLDRMPPPRVVPKAQKYDGVSARVKQRLATREDAQDAPEGEGEEPKAPKPPPTAPRVIRKR